MSFPPWSKIDKVGAARYVNKKLAAAALGQLSENRFDLPDDPDGRRRLLELIYDKLIEAGVYYDLEPFNYDDQLQEIRTPLSILDGDRRGTCLDLSLLFAGVAEAYDLVPVLVVMKDHAFVLVSLKNSIEEWNSIKRTEKGKLGDVVDDPTILNELVDSGTYLAVECTGFAASAKLRDHTDELHPETVGRDELGLMSFEQAVNSGKEQLTRRQLGFALDLAMAHRTIPAFDLGQAWTIHSEREPAAEVSAETDQGTARVSVADESTVSLDVSSPHGARVDPVTEEDSRPTVELPTPIAPSLKPVKPFFGRERERTFLKNAIERDKPAGAFASGGSGKSALLSNIAYRDDYERPLGAGVVYVRSATTHLDALLREIHNAFYASDEPTRPSDQTIRRRLSDKEALILVDDLNLDPAAVEDLGNALPKSAIVLATEHKATLGAARSLPLPGLAPDEALEFLAEQIFMPIPAEDAGDARRLVEAVDGHPGLLIEAADAIVGGASFKETADRFSDSADHSATVADTLSTDLTDTQKMVVEILGSASAPVSLELLEQLVAITEPDAEGKLDDELRELLASQRVESHSPRFSLTGTVAEGVLRHWQLADWSEALLSQLADWSESPDITHDEINRSRQLILRVLEWGAEAGRWADVLRVARATDRSVALGGDWTAWHHVLSSGLQAAEHLGDESARAWALHQLGSRAIGIGDDAAALAHLTEALDIRTGLGETDAIEVTRHNLDLVTAPPLLLDPLRPGLVTAGLLVILLFLVAPVAAGDWTATLHFQPNQISFENTVPNRVETSSARLVNDTPHDIDGIAITVTSDSGDFSLVPPAGVEKLRLLDACRLDDASTIALESGASCQVAIYYARSRAEAAFGELAAVVARSDGGTANAESAALWSRSGDVEVLSASPTTVQRTAATPAPSETPVTSAAPAPAQLDIDIVDGPSSVRAGSTVAYDINLSNAGPVVTDITIEVDAGPFVTVSLATEDGAACGGRCEIGRMTTGEERTVKASVRVSEEAEPGSSSFSAAVDFDAATVGQRRSDEEAFSIVALGRLDVRPNTVGFATVELGASAFEDAVLTNVGLGKLTIEGIDIAGSDAFGVEGCGGESLEPGQSCTIFVTFGPSAVGAASADLVITHDGLGGETRLSATGSGGNPVPTTPPTTPVSFVDVKQEVLIFTGTDAQAVEIVNVGTGPVTISGVTDPTNFTLTGCSGVTLAAGASCTFTVEFDGTADACEVVELDYTGAGDRRILLKGFG